MATLETFLQQTASYVKQSLPGLPAYSRVSRKQIENNITQCLEKYRGLALRLDNYAPDGRPNELTNMALLALEGTIPMSYREKHYNIPVSIRLPQGFPITPPACYVLQRNGLVLKPQHTVVTPTGLCNFSRFEKARWDPKHSSVRDLVDLMVRVFSMEPPLYSPTSATQQALASSAPLTPSFSLPKLVKAAVLASKPAAKQAWDPKEPTQEELALPLEIVNTLLAKLEADDADHEDATDDAFQSLRDEKVKLEEYLKMVRRLSREQFLNRALAEKAAHLKPFLEEREATLTKEEAEREAAEQAERARREHEAEQARREEEERLRQEKESKRMEEERQRAEEERRRGEEERRRAEEERQRQEEERRREAEEQYERKVIEEQRRIAALAAQRAEQEELDRAEQERLWREEQQQQEARQKQEEEDRRLAEIQERADRERLQRMELQQMQAATLVGVQGGGWPPQGGGQFGSYNFAPSAQSPRPDPFRPAFGAAYPQTSPPILEPASPVRTDDPPVAFPRPSSSQYTVSSQPFSTPPMYSSGPGPQNYPGPYPAPYPGSSSPFPPPYPGNSNSGPPPYPGTPSPFPPPYYGGSGSFPPPYPGSAGPIPPPYQGNSSPFGPPPNPYMPPQGPYVQPHAEGPYGMPGMWPPTPPTGYRY